MKSKDQHFYLKELAGRECQCGKAKKPRMSFCYLCYKTLPGHMQKELYQRVGNGYEEAYDEALQHLTT